MIFRHIAEKKIPLSLEVEKVKLNTDEIVKKKGKIWALAFVFSFSTIVICGLAGFIGMFFLWPPAPCLFSIYVAAPILASSLLSHTVQSGIEELFGHLETFLEGVILTLIFFGPAKDLFF